MRASLLAIALVFCGSSLAAAQLDEVLKRADEAVGVTPPASATTKSSAGLKQALVLSTGKAAGLSLENPTDS